ncbi:unnamed protein product [Sympodiomycopsis kandeliae]
MLDKIKRWISSRPSNQGRKSRAFIEKSHESKWTPPVKGDVSPFEEPPVDQTREDIAQLLDHIDSHSGPSSKLMQAALDFHQRAAVSSSSQDTLQVHYGSGSGDDDRHDAVLDLGCGAGQLTCHLARYFRLVYARDPDAEMVKMCRLMVALYGPRRSLNHAHEYLQVPSRQSRGQQRIFDIANGSDDDLNMTPQSVDCIIACNSAHLWDWSAPQAVYDRLSTVLKAGGSLIIIGSRPLAGRYILDPDNGPETTLVNNHLSNLIKGLPSDLNAYTSSPRFQIGFMEMYQNLPLPTESRLWNLTTCTYSKWITTPDTSSSTEPRRTHWNLGEIVSWLRSLPPYQLHAGARQTDEALNRDLAARLVKEACEKDGVNFSMGVKVELESYEAIWAIRRSDLPVTPRH